MLKSTARLMLIGVVFAVLYVGVSRVLAFAADGEIHQLARWVLHEVRRSEALHQRRTELAELMTIKQTATADFIAGRLTLREAARQFSLAGELVHDDSDGLIAPYVSMETEQGVCLQVEIWVEMVLSDGYTPEEVEEVRCRLDEEMNELFPSAERQVN